MRSEVLRKRKNKSNL